MSFLFVYCNSVDCKFDGACDITTAIATVSTIETCSFQDCLFIASTTLAGELQQFHFSNNSHPGDFNIIKIRNLSDFIRGLSNFPINFTSNRIDLNGPGKQKQSSSQISQINNSYWHMSRRNYRRRFFVNFCRSETIPTNSVHPIQYKLVKRSYIWRISNYNINLILLSGGGRPAKRGMSVELSVRAARGGGDRVGPVGG